MAGDLRAGIDVVRMDVLPMATREIAPIRRDETPES